MRASDIHIEPFADRVRIRYRIDGVCMERDSAPRRLLGSIVSRLKIMGSIDIAEKRRPQDGRIKIHVAGKDIDLRVSILPTVHGQSVVMRILDRDNIKVGLRDLGFGDEDWKRFQHLIKRPNGILLVTGPTGSGKTTTLYAALNELNRPDVKIITAEDPVEYYLPGRQPVRGQGQDRDDLRTHHSCHAPAESEHPPGRRNPRRGDGQHRNPGFSDRTLGFQYTAHERCAQCCNKTGRYRRAAVPGRQLGHGDHGPASRPQGLPQVQGPRSSPRPTSCRASGLRPEIAKKANFMKGKGCSHCNKTGYRGRMGIYELMVMTSQIREMTFKGESTQVIRKVARKQGMRTLFEDGMIKAMKGQTTLEEVLRITQHEMLATEPRPSRLSAPAAAAVGAGPATVEPRLAGPCAGAESTASASRPARRARPGRVADGRNRKSARHRLIWHASVPQ